MWPLFRRRPKTAPAVAGAEQQPPEPGPAVSSSHKTFPSSIKELHCPENATAERGPPPHASEPWPKALLPSVLPTARVLTFGYDAYVVDWRRMVSESRIGNHTWHLLTALAFHREKDDTALVKSREQVEPHLQNILRYTRGIAFLGTPHHGAGLARSAELLARLIGIVKQTNTEIVVVLQSQSEVLARIQDSFHTMVKSRGENGSALIDICCFYEEMPLPGVEVVPQDSAVIPGYSQIPIRGNHMDMARFAAANDQGFVLVSGQLRLWIKQMDRRRAWESRGSGGDSTRYDARSPDFGTTGDHLQSLAAILCRTRSGPRTGIFP
ncbi:hypothetical protein GE09DRAFT_1176189 [Coniochaeta sp. 2T2.1]|nr:hypothetical protein GE09DRAFT_1176189 [Coniochaeta sp. 2T2.1]